MILIVLSWCIEYLARSAENFRLQNIVTFRNQTKLNIIKKMRKTAYVALEMGITRECLHFYGICLLKSQFK